MKKTKHEENYHIPMCPALAISRTRKILLTGPAPPPGQAFIVLKDYYSWCIYFGWELPEGVPP